MAIASFLKEWGYLPFFFLLSFRIDVSDKFCYRSQASAVDISF
jgi:hypothetical protein